MFADFESHSCFQYHPTSFFVEKDATHLRQQRGQGRTTGDRPRKELLTIRGVQVMLDRDLAELYGVPTRRLNEQVKRNIRRFPENFMFQLSKTEFEEWRSQNATSNFDSD